MLTPDQIDISCHSLQPFKPRLGLESTFSVNDQCFRNNFLPSLWQPSNELCDSFWKKYLFRTTVKIFSWYDGHWGMYLLHRIKKLSCGYCCIFDMNYLAVSQLWWGGLSSLVGERTIQLPCVHLLWRQWSLLNHFQRELGHCGTCQNKQGLTENELVATSTHCRLGLSNQTWQWSA